MTYRIRYAPLPFTTSRGHKATVETVQRMRFRQNHVTALTEYAWGQGDLYAEYRCSPGVPADYYEERSRHVVLISLRGKSAGDTMTLRTHRLVMEGFTRNKEYWESDVYHRIQKLDLRIIFPLERPCQRATTNHHRGLDGGALPRVEGGMAARASQLQHLSVCKDLTWGFLRRGAPETTEHPAILYGASRPPPAPVAHRAPHGT